MIANAATKGNLSEGKEYMSGLHLLGLCIGKDESCSSGRWSIETVLVL